MLRIESGPGSRHANFDTGWEEEEMRIGSVILVLTLFCGLGALACSSLKVATDFDPNADFTKIRSYAWLDERSGVEGDRNEVSSLLDQRIRRAIDAELLGKGLAISERDSADVLVSYHLGVEKKLDVNTIHTGYGYGRYGGYGGGRTETYVSEYEEGTFLVDLIEPSKKELIWRGSGQARVKRSSSPEDREERVREVVAKVLAAYPPGAK